MAARSTLTLFSLLLWLLASCSQYQAPQGSAGFAQPGERPHPPGQLNGLQLSALRSMHVGNHDQAIQYLQRAINVEPRNPLNWHYLAQNYWSRGDFEQCREMVNRSRAYSRLDPDLERANRALAMQCGCEQNGGCQ